MIDDKPIMKQVHEYENFTVDVLNEDMKLCESHPNIPCSNPTCNTLLSACGLSLSTSLPSLAYVCFHTPEPLLLIAADFIGVVKV